MQNHKRFSPIASGKTSLCLSSAMVWANLYIISDTFWSTLVPELTVFWFDHVENVYFINHVPKSNVGKRNSMTGLLH